MNFKRNLFVITSALVGALALSGCDFGISKFSHYEYIYEAEDKHEDIEKEGYVKYGNYDSYKVKDNKGDEMSLGSAYETFRDYGMNSNIPSTGDQKIIVVPVSFSDYKVDKLNITEQQYIDRINKAFFGNSKNNEYVSVGEYFNKSSYGKLRLDGKICDKIYEFPLSVSDIKEKKLHRDALATDYYKKVIDWYKQTYPEDDISKYEIPGLKTGKNIAIYMVYTYPSEEKTEEDTENFFWAYTFSDVPLSWSSYSFSVPEYDEPDAHTYIHETGHLLGLNDYYPTLAPKNKDTVVIEPTSFIDMMDASVGDETGFSKMYLDWTRPYYVTDNCEIQIKPFTESGDLILLSNNWNKTVFDEYYLLEFYTPTYLNAHDVSFGNNLAKLPKIPGIKVYHVDARLAFITSSGKVPIEYCKDGTFGTTSSNVGYAHDNNTYDNPNKFQKNYLYQLILNNPPKEQSVCATDANLFRVGDEIPALKFNQGDEFLYQITINSLQFSGSSIKFEKIKKHAK
ncbi:MAG: hypothetical protein KBS97_03055 [Firmicutes bacterium]|nr:hypothetical protein [Candidatus Fiminaster equi]